MEGFSFGSSDDFFDEERFFSCWKEKGLIYEDGYIFNRYKVKLVVRGVKIIFVFYRINIEIFKDWRDFMIFIGCLDFNVRDFILYWMVLLILMII